MGLSLDDILAAPRDPELLNRHLQNLGLISSPTAQPAETLMPFTPPKVLSGPPATVPLKPFTPPRPEHTPPATAAPSDMSSPLVKPMTAPTLSEEQKKSLPITSPGPPAGSVPFYEGELERAIGKRPDSMSDHPSFLGKVGHVLGRVGNVALDALAPGIASAIPGTDIYNRMNERAAEGNLAQAQEREGQEKLRTARTREAEARADALENPEEKGGKTPEEITLHDLMTGGENGTPRINPDTKKPYTYLEAYQSVKQAAQDVKPVARLPEAEQPLGADVNSINKQLENRYQVLHPGKPLPDEYKIPENATKGDYARIDKALAATENAEGTKSQRDTVNEMRRQTMAMNAKKKDASEEAIEAAAQSLAKGDLTRLKDIASLRGDQRLLIFNRVKELNPKFSTADIDRKIKMMDSYTVGKDGQQLQSFGTFLEHAGAAADALGAIQQHDMPAANKPINWWKKNISGDPNFQAFTTSLEPVRKEFEGFLLGGRALYGDDRKNAEIILNDDSSPSQIGAALKQMGHTVQARYNEMDHRFKGTMGKPMGEVLDPISDEARQGATKIGIKLKEEGAQGGGGGKTYTDADVQAAVAAHPGITAQQVEDAFKKKNWTKK